MSSPIPIKNIYYLLIYAWNKLDEGEVTDVTKLESQELVDLFASVLNSGVKHLLRRGINRDYLLHDAEIPGVRGRIKMAPTIRRMLIQHGRTQCEFDELSVDSLPNQILRSTVLRLLRAPSLDPTLRLDLRGLNRELGGIATVQVTKHTFRKVQLHSNNRFYRFLLEVCELVLDLSIASEDEGDLNFRDFIRDEQKMARLFEDFVFNFIRVERPDLSVRKERISWHATSAADPNLSYLPTMETDITVRRKNPAHTLIIDTKFYKETFSKYYDKESIHSANLYQIYSYLKNLEYGQHSDASADGMLLYPVIDRSTRLSYDVPGHNIQICTLNLSADWQEIRDELVGLVPITPSESNLTTASG